MECIENSFVRSALLSVELAATLLLTGAAHAQSSVRCWNQTFFDTESRQGQCVRVSASDRLAGIVRADGRAFLHGGDNLLACSIPEHLLLQAFWQVSARRGLGVGLLANGDVQVWGALASTMPPVPSLPPGVHYEQIARGASHIVALRSDGQLEAWGSTNAQGQLTVPQVPLGLSVITVGAGQNHNAILLSDGSIAAWGDNSYGQLNVPTAPVGLFYERLDVGREHMVAVRSDGNVVAWGDNSLGETAVPSLPVGTSYVLASAGEAHSNALRSDGVIVSWGDNTWDQLEAPAIPPGLDVVQIDSDRLYSIALLSNGKVMAWGNRGSTLGSLPFLPEDSTGGLLDTFAQIANGRNHFVWLTASGAVVGWGKYGASDYLTPGSFAGQVFRKVAAGSLHSLALRADGELFAWGPGQSGVLNVPAHPPGVPYSDVVCHEHHCVALLFDGSAVAWGRNLQGEGSIPPPPAGVLYVQAAVSEESTVLLRSDDVIVYLGSVQPTPEPEPVLPQGVHWRKVVLTDRHVVGLRSDGMIELWGHPGVTSAGWRAVPALPDGVYYTDVDGRYRYSVLRRSDGLLETCGIVPLNGEVVPPLLPGTSYLRADAAFVSSAIVGPTSTYVSIGAGCAGSLPASRLVPADTPFIGRTLEVSIFDLPADIAMMTMGWQPRPAPVSLASIGMPGCFQHISVAGAALLAGADSVVEWQLAIPSNPLLVGVEFYNQALVLDPGANNGLSAVVSDAAKGVVGVL